jgi:hypothetical protein
LRISCDFLKDVPTRTVVSKGTAIAARLDYVEAYAALGMKLHFLESEEAITIPTHAFETLRCIRSAPFADLSGFST